MTDKVPVVVMMIGLWRLVGQPAIQTAAKSSQQVNFYVWQKYGNKTKFKTTTATKKNIENNAQL